MSRAMAAILNLRSLEALIVQAGMGSVARHELCGSAGEAKAAAAAGADA